MPETPPDRILHVATTADWERARASGDYRISTHGATLDDVGFVHAAFPEQVAGVLERYYADVEDDLVVLVIDPGRLEVPVRIEAPAGSAETFPHVYGPIPLDAVVDVVPVGRTPDGEPRWDVGGAADASDAPRNG